MFNPKINPISSRQIPSKVLKNQINLAMMEIQGNIVRTPCEKTYFLNKDDGINLFLKKENRQITGSFEARSALYVLLKLSDAQKRNGVISASTADFALSLCHFGDKLKIPVTVVLPQTTQLKIHTCQQTTSTMIFKGDNLNQARVFALMLAKEKNMHYLKRCHADMLTGYGTLAMEIMEEVPYVEAVLVPYDKTELIKSFKMVMKDSNIKIITVEPQDIKSDEDVQSEGEIIVEKSVIATAMLYLFRNEKCIVDIGGAACLGAMLDDSIRYEYKLKGKRVVVVLPSCHINMINLIQYVEQELISKHRLMKFALMIPKQPPSIAELHNMLMQLKVIIKNIQIQRKQTSMSEINVKVVCGIKNEQHAKIIIDIIKLKYKNCKLKISNNFNSRSILTE